MTEEKKRTNVIYFENLSKILFKVKSRRKRSLKEVPTLAVALY